MVREGEQGAGGSAIGARGFYGRKVLEQGQAPGIVWWWWGADARQIVREGGRETFEGGAEKGPQHPHLHTNSPLTLPNLPPYPLPPGFRCDAYMT